MSRLLPALLLVAVLAVIVSGCGGQKITADEVPGPPVALTVPEVTKGGANQLAGSSSSSSSSTSADATPTPTGTPEASTGTQSGTSGTSTTQSGTSGTTGTQGTAQQPSQQTGGTNTGQSPSGGQQPFDDFCKKNPGAC
jgi:type IV secretory pathway TrbL component